MTQHDPRLQEAAAKLTEGFILALTALNNADAPAEPPAQAKKPEAKKAEPKAEPEAKTEAKEPESESESESEEITSEAVKKALVDAAKKHGRDAVMPLLEATGEGVRTADAVPANKRAALIRELGLL
ncbi:MAG: hypothetical protein AAF183_18035 [Pseudomonadota bacterium]